MNLKSLAVKMFVDEAKDNGSRYYRALRKLQRK